MARKEEFLTVNFRLKTITPDPLQFKPRMPVLEGDELFVCVDVPKRYFRGESGKVLTLEGLRYVANQLYAAMNNLEVD